MHNTVKIREIKSDDFPEWEVLWNEYNQFYGRFGDTALSDEITETTWNRFFNESEPVFCLVAELDKKLVGIVHFIFHRNTIMIENTCYLQDLSVSEMHRGKHIGKRLIDAVCENAIKFGTKKVYWHTHETNMQAMSLYDKIANKTGFLLYTKVSN